MPGIMRSVGRNGMNSPQDVKIVQQLLNQNASKMGMMQRLAVDGKVGPKTIGAIERYQKMVLKFNNIDGRVDPGGKTITSLNSGGGGGVPMPKPNNPSAPKANVGNLNLVVKRTKACDLSTMGVLSVNGTQICYTLEEKWRDNQKGHSCVGLGTYSAFIRYTSTKSKREWCFQLNDANGRSAIQMHIGNKPSHTEGCILVGTTSQDNFVGGSTEAYQKLQDFVFGPGFTRKQIRDAKPKFGAIQFTFVDQTPGISGHA